ncbi:MAG: hypothetical protein FWD61_05035 [Phycisphaerales bacterium]|nr:hypothetical protein [Phycisphaerales bacterium]
MMGIRQSWMMAMMVVMCGVGGGICLGQLKELNSYMLMEDEVVSRAADAGKILYYTTDKTLATAKLKEYGVKYPDNISFPQGATLVILVSDRVQESFESLSMDAQKQMLVVDLAADKKAAPKVEEGKKSSRVLLIGSPSRITFKKCGIRGADGKVVEVKSEELKKK